VKEIFGDASERPEGERAGFVREAAEDDAEIESEVLRLLALDDGAEERLAGAKPPGDLVQSAADQHVFYPGEVLAGRYAVVRFLAMGGMGEVYEADDLELGHRIAIKAIRGEFTDDDHMFWLKREVRSARRIQHPSGHPNVCRVYDLVNTQSAAGSRVVFLTMELLVGETLTEKLRREGTHTERQAMPLVRQMVAALAAAHRAGVVHRDFKSSNVMVMARANGPPRRPCDGWRPPARPQPTPMQTRAVPDVRRSKDQCEEVCRSRGQAPRRHTMPHFPDFLLFVEVHQVYRKLHEEGVDRFAGDNPQAFAGVQPLVLEQAGPPFFAGIRHIRSFGENGTAGMIPHQYFHFEDYSPQIVTPFSSILRLP
jgi:serine/threonine protein kinase